MSRVLSAIIFLPILLLIIWRGSPIYFSGLIFVAAILGLLEYKNIAEQVGLKASSCPVFIAALAILSSFYFHRPDLIVRAADAADVRRGPDGAYVGFLTADGPKRIHAAYPVVGSTKVAPFSANSKLFT